eukprot:CAMPEP_0113933544 /NCGR_PEP_ID=MMETSP1339-20121228/610_1 /TAXON_ID=94617 /ORGANISM="Fibrocapsa japonica" /LENGTH=557 /DNA_ID=CAMNT_0000934851 /DNA_START=159 /DNA_END=1832 /DNA_ORIENTATION=- /assembly_acc=CAM_ASM_000762
MPAFGFQSSFAHTARSLSGTITRNGVPMMAASPEMTWTEPPSFSIAAEPTVTADKWAGDLLVLPFYQKESPEEEDESSDEKKEVEVIDLTADPSPAGAKELDDLLGGALSDLIKSEEFNGKAGSSAVVRLVGSSAATRVAVVGMGKEKEADVKAFNKLGAFVGSTASSTKAEKVGVALPSSPSEVGQPLLQAALEGLHASLYKDVRFKSDDEAKKPCKLSEVQVLGLEDIEEASKGASAVAAGINYVCDLVNAPANYMTPRAMAQTAKDLASNYDNLSCKILEQKEIEELKMGAYLGVAQGAVEPPHFIHLTYKPKGEVKTKLAVIGKGLTFDSGGYNLKVGASMIELMKFDMGGSALTLGTCKALSELALEGVEVHFIIAACENMVSKNAMRPGDILTASNGKTIEVINTDAEGRLTLADALVYAEKLEVDKIVDSATLTGACIVGLGTSYAGLFSSDDDLAEELKTSAKDAGEAIWHMPLGAEYYAEELKSKIADLKNVGSRYGGAITAALFLKEFVKKTPWAHIDIAGPVWNQKEGGATGYGVRTLTNWIKKQA